MPSCEVYRAAALWGEVEHDTRLPTSPNTRGTAESDLGAAGQLQVQAAASRRAEDER